MNTLHNQILEELQRENQGSIFFPDQFLKYGSDDAVYQALSRLEHRGYITRIAHGIYLYQESDSKIGMVMPAIEEIAQAIAKRDLAKIIPTGNLALHKLGLTLQVPMNAVYLTDGSPRIVKVGNRTIKFKKTTPKNLAVKGEISGLVIHALKAIGRMNITDDQILKIQQLLQKEKPKDLEHDAGLAPAWIRDIMNKVIKSS